MSRIEELIAELCPAGVEFKTLEELGAIYGGLTGKTKADFSDGNARYVSYKNIFNNLVVDTEADDFVKIAPNENQNSLQVGDVLFTGSSETSDEVGMAAVVMQKPSKIIYLNSFCFGYRFNADVLILPSFSKYIFRSDSVRHQIVMSASGVTRFNISKKRFLKVRIPIPPTEIQHEIVKVLDTFTELEAGLKAELGAELEARRRQYKDYRDTMLAFSDQDIRWAAMGEIGEFVRGRRFTKADYMDAGIECIHYGDIYTQYGTVTETAVSHLRADMRSTLRYAGPGDLIIAGVGETVEDVGKAVAWLGHGEVAIHDDCFAFRHSLNPRFVSYYFQTSAFHAEKNKFVARAKVKRLSAESLAKLTIPVPSPEEQARIVAILDKFDALINEISLSLPAEIAARRRQYAYYRDRLLTFKEVV
ncbi:restriction endonuclease [Pseudomonas fluorescens]|uniref:restriction endonuclease subunit S n=1 Tax=Pseudomonas fluorescens TaxID=294 RepID=UPI00058545D5|nr:restriction endonuclease subunit S [Pseudomonas fluorescens]KIF62918.1 restriction endonuclease [Pseudomonas fluorescens]